MEHPVVALTVCPSLVRLCRCYASSEAQNATYRTAHAEADCATDHPGGYVPNYMQCLSTSDRNEAPSRLVVT